MKVWGIGHLLCVRRQLYSGGASGAARQALTRWAA